MSLFEENKIEKTKNAEPSDRTLLVDFDSPVYQSCYGLDDEPFEAAIGSILLKVDYIKSRTNCKDVLFFLTSGRESFRYKLSEFYKQNRIAASHLVPLQMRPTKDYLAEHFGNVVVCRDWEADDIVVSLYKSDPSSYMICASDKDVLNSCSGEHFNSVKDTWVTIDELTALRWPYLQCLTGDSSDNIKGLHRVGPKTAEKILAEADDERKLWRNVLKAYSEKGLSEADAILTMRLVNCNQIRNNKVELWEPPIL